MFKLVRLSNIKMGDGNLVLSVEHEILDTIESLYDEDEIIRLKNQYDDNGIFVLWNFDDDNEIITCEAVLFDDFVDVAEWDFRVYSSVAARDLDYDFWM